MTLSILSIVIGSLILLVFGLKAIVPLFGAGIGQGVNNTVRWNQQMTHKIESGTFIADGISKLKQSHAVHQQTDAQTMQMHEQAVADHQRMHDDAVAMNEQVMQDQLMMDEMNQMSDPYQNPGQDIVVDESFHGIDHGSDFANDFGHNDFF